MSGPPVQLPDATKLAVDRTRLAHDRTLMAWVRTSTSLISFGFTMYKFFQYLHDTRQGAPERMIGPRGFAMIMIAIGLAGLVLATIDHRRSMVALRTEYGGIVPPSLTTVLATLIASLGILLFIAVAFRW
jgi:putative membrane protein